MNFCEKEHFKNLRDSWEDLAGNVREVWGSTRGTPMPCLWFLEFVERQALRCYRMVVLGWTPLSQKPIPRPVAQNNSFCNSQLTKNALGLFFVWGLARNDISIIVNFYLWLKYFYFAPKNRLILIQPEINPKFLLLSFFDLFCKSKKIESPLKTAEFYDFLVGAKYITNSRAFVVLLRKAK